MRKRKVIGVCAKYAPGSWRSPCPLDSASRLLRGQTTLSVAALEVSHRDLHDSEGFVDICLVMWL